MTVIFTAKPTLKIELECEEQDWELANEISRKEFIREELLEYMDSIVDDIIKDGQIKLIK